MRVFGLWYGGNGYSAGHFTTDGESWASLADAKQSLRDRYQSGYWLRDKRGRVVNVDEDGTATLGPETDDLRPCVTEESEIHLYPFHKVGRNKWVVDCDYPYAIVKLGPRRGVVVEPA